MNDKSSSSIRKFWTRLEGAVHPDDKPIFDQHPDHTFNLDFPPPAFIGDVDTAPIVVLMSNGGYNDGETQKEFPDSASFYEHRDYLRGERIALPRHLSGYYMNGPLGPWIAEGSAVLVNAVAYRSPKLSSEKNNRQVAKQLPCLAAHSRWLLDELLPEARAGKRFVLVHRNGWWKVPRDEHEGPCVVFSNPAKGEPNRRTPDGSKLDLAGDWLRWHYRSLGPDHSALAKIARNFANRFRPWGIRLPMPVLAARQPGRVYSEGWFIWYSFGSDRSGEFLDYYAVHRMTSDHHVRLYQDGRSEGLPVMADWCPTSSDPVEAAAMKTEYFARNREIGSMLRAKGFDLDHDWSADEDSRRDVLGGDSGRRQ